MTRLGAAGGPRALLLARALFTTTTEGLTSLWDQVKTSFHGWMQQLRRRLEFARTEILIWLRGLTGFELVSLLGLCLVGIVMIVQKRRAQRILAHWYRWRRCIHLWRALQNLEDTVPPQERVRSCYEFVEQLLALARYRRPGNTDLLEFVELIAHREPSIAVELRVLYYCVSQQLFSLREVNRADAARSMECACRLRDRLMARVRLFGVSRPAPV